MKKLITTTLIWALPTLGLAQEAQVSEALPSEEAQCPEPVMLVNRATSDVENYFLAEAEAELAEALQGMGCGKAADAELLGKYWQAAGILALFQGDTERGEQALSASARDLPDRWNGNFGSKHLPLYAHSPSEERGKLVVKGHRGKDVLVDGTPTKVPADLEPGLHIVQVGTFPDASEYATEVSIAAGTEAIVMANVAAPTTTTPTDVPAAPVSNGSSRPLAIGAGGAVAVAVGSFLVASAAHQQFVDAPDDDAAAPHLKRNHAMNVVGLSASAAGAGLLSVAVLKGQW